MWSFITDAFYYSDLSSIPTSPSALLRMRMSWVETSSLLAGMMGSEMGFTCTFMYYVRMHRRTHLRDGDLERELLKVLGVAVGDDGLDDGVGLALALLQLEHHAHAFLVERHQRVLCGHSHR